MRHNSWPGRISKANLVLYTYNTSAQEVDTAESGVQDQPDLRKKFEVCIQPRLYETLSQNNKHASQRGKD